MAAVEMDVDNFRVLEVLHVKNIWRVRAEGMPIDLDLGQLRLLEHK
jgi:hypothetical protein